MLSIEDIFDPNQQAPTGAAIENTTQLVAAQPISPPVQQSIENTMQPTPDMDVDSVPGPPSETPPASEATGVDSEPTQQQMAVVRPENGQVAVGDQRSRSRERGRSMSVENHHRRNTEQSNATRGTRANSAPRTVPSKADGDTTFQQSVTINNFEISGSRGIADLATRTSSAFSQTEKAMNEITNVCETQFRQLASNSKEQHTHFSGEVASMMHQECNAGSRRILPRAQERNQLDPAAVQECRREDDAELCELPVERRHDTERPVDGESDN